MHTYTLARVGHETLIRALRDIFRASSFGHAITLAGPDRLAIQQIAQWVSECSVCEDSAEEPCGRCSGCQSIARGLHEQVITLEPGPTGYAVEDIRSLRRALQLRSTRRIVVLHQANLLRGAAANALLKTLEEPLGDVRFVLTVPERQSLLPTLRSRTMLFYVQRVPTEQAIKALVAAGYPKSAVERVLRAYPGMPATAAAVLEQPVQLQAMQLLDTLAEKLPRVPLVQRLREMSSVFESSMPLNVQRDKAQALTAAAARTWPRALPTVQALCETSRVLQSNAQPRFILDALLTRI